MRRRLGWRVGGERVKGLRWVVCLMGLGLLRPAMATPPVDAVAIMAGTALHVRTHVRMVRVALQRHWHEHWLPYGRWSLTGYWEMGFGCWDNEAGDAGNSTLESVDFRPVLRWQYDNPSSGAPAFYAEFGTGPALLSATEIDNRRLSSAFQFGSHIGFGVSFGLHRRFEVAYRLMHYSNAGIKHPNDGATFNVLVAAGRF